MPEMKTLTVNGVKYDLRDSTAARTRLPYIYAGTGGEQFYQVCKATMSSTWTRAFATFIFTNAYAGTRFTAVVAARVIRGSDIVVEYDQIAGKNIADRLYYYMDTVNSTVYFYYHKPTNEEWYVTSLNQDGSMTAEIQPIGASLAAYTGKAIYELGASAPAGYGLGVNYGGDCADCNTATNNGWYNITSATAHCPVVNGVTHNVATMFVVSRVSRIWQTIYSYTNATEAILQRHSFDSGSTWSNWVNVSPSAFAPAGFGLGTHATAVSDFNEATVTGWYSGGRGTANKPFGYSLVHVINRNGTEVLQIGYDMASTTSGSYAAWTSQIRRRSNNTWSEWEYVNPPMYVGVEYRTTERWNGRPVYTKLIDMGAMPNASVLQVDIGIPSASTRIISSNFMALNTARTALHTDISRYTTEAYFISGYNENWFYSANTTDDMSTYNASMIIKYVKV